MKIIVTGGLGYIGSHTTVALAEAGYDVVIVDNMSNSLEAMLPRIKSLCNTDVQFENCDLRERDAVVDLFAKHQGAYGVIHFAASKAVGESVERPLLYYQNNLDSLIHVLQAMEAVKSANLIFSSSCTVYGEPETLPVTEDSPIQSAKSPYGNTKQIGEEIISDSIKGNELDLNCISLRYFNPIGAHSSAQIGELPLGTPANLLPYVMNTAAGKYDHLRVWGDDYPTRDGTAIRDYIHVMDLAEAHVLALQKLIELDQNYGFYDVYNVGTGRGSSVLEVLLSASKAVGHEIPYQVYPRRHGDIIEIYAHTQKVEQELDWKATRDLDTMTSSAWRWTQALEESEIIVPQ